VQFKTIASTFEKLEQTRSGNALRTILSQLFKQATNKEIALLAYFSLGDITSKYDSTVIGMADKMVVKAIAKATSIDKKTILEQLKKHGDIGKTAEEFIGKKTRSVTLHDVHATLMTLAHTHGANSQEKKISLLATLFNKTSPKESRYIARMVVGKLRLGIADMTVLDALSITFTGGKEKKKTIEAAYNICPDVGIIAHTLATKGLKGITTIDIQIGRPIQMMLAQRVKNLVELQKRIPGIIVAEEKYDGERVQAHKSKNTITLFSRRLDTITHQFPDIVTALKKVKGDWIIEGEICAVDTKGNVLPFQILMQRRRKHKIEEYAQKIPVCMFVFEILLLNKKSYREQPYHKRMDVLKKLIPKTKQLNLAGKVISRDLKKITAFFNEKINAGGEGIMCKKYDGLYHAGTRGWDWIKWKKEYVKDLVDTFDLVVVGAYWGKGRRSGWYGALLCALYNKQKDRFETFCKLGTGFTDEDLAALPKKLKKYIIVKKPARVEIKKSMLPDVYFTPAVVVEVLGAEVTKSPNHTADGLALRFPRFLRFRPDKTAEQATTTQNTRKIAKLIAK